MGQYDDAEDELDGSEPGAFKQMRDQLKKLKEQNRDLIESNTRLETTVRTRVIADTLTSRGVSPKIAQFVPSDIEPTEESVTAWLIENAEVFGVRVQPTAQEQQLQGQAEHTRQLAGVEAFSTPAIPGDILDQVQNASSMDELVALGVVVGR